MAPFTDVRAITFDIDNTLFDLSAVLERAMADAVLELHSHVEPGVADHVDIAHLAQLREAVAEEMAHERDTHGDWLVEVRRESFRRLVADLGVPNGTELTEHVAEAFFRARHGGITLYAGALEALTELRERFTLGIITNGNSSLADTPIRDFFACNIVASERGWSKPDVRIFEAAARELDLEPQHMLHIGDSLPEDIAGAQAAGLRAIWFNPVGLVNESDVVPDAEIQRFEELPPLVASLPR
jgi:putative hydrolase of the HAD superfamily